MKRAVHTLLLLFFSTNCASTTAKSPSDALFDGQTTKGWRLMAVHGGRGGVWVVQGGALVADHDTDFTGGLLATEKKFSDFEIEMEFQADFPADSGLYFRTTDKGEGYQATIDYRTEGTVGSLYAKGYLVRNDDWEKLYVKTGWNRLRVRAVGAPAHIQIWLNGVSTVDFTDDKNLFPAEGYIGLQVHGGTKNWGPNNKARFKNIRLQNLARP